MTWLHRTNRFFQLLFRKRRLEDDLDAEVQAYMKMLMDRHVAAGMPEEDALRAARIEFEGIEQVKEQVRRCEWAQTLRRSCRTFATPGVR